MHVQLLTHTPDPERIVAGAARLCYSDSSIDDLIGREQAEQEQLLRKILELGHLSVLEHASFTFGVEGISRACSHQLVRHRLASYSQQSQRYVSFDDTFDAVTPPSIAGKPELAGKYAALIEQLHQSYVELVEAGVPAEDARFVLPNAAATKIVITMNGRELKHFFHLRCCRRAQWEIQIMARQMLKLARQTAPLLFASAGPGCLEGPCPEGAMTCGAVKEVRQEFSDL
ncbi:MAG: thymidylate synthase (FAD) [Desulfuromonas sp.]|nr:MAG: thymidylate synthase (FAD) [Desulfuromonas sp.]